MIIVKRFLKKNRGNTQDITRFLSFFFLGGGEGWFLELKKKRDRIEHPYRKKKWATHLTLQWISSFLFDLNFSMFCFLLVSRYVNIDTYIFFFSLALPLVLCIVRENVLPLSAWKKTAIYIFIRLFLTEFAFVLSSLVSSEDDEEKKRQHLSVFGTNESIFENRFEIRSLYVEQLFPSFYFVWRSISFSWTTKKEDIFLREMTRIFNWLEYERVIISMLHIHARTDRRFMSINHCYSEEEEEDLFL